MVVLMSRTAMSSLLIFGYLLPLSARAQNDSIAKESNRKFNPDVIRLGCSPRTDLWRTRHLAVGRLYHPSEPSFQRSYIDEVLGHDSNATKLE